MTREVEARALYKCPACHKTHVVKVKARVRPRLTIHPDLTESESYELEDVRIEGCA